MEVKGLIRSVNYCNIYGIIMLMHGWQSSTNTCEMCKIHNEVFPYTVTSVYGTYHPSCLLQ